MKQIIENLWLIHGNQSYCNLSNKDVWSIIKEAAIDNHVSTALFSYELSNTEMIKELLSHITGIPISTIQEERLKQSEFNSISEAVNALTHTPLYLTDAQSFLFSELKDTIQTMVQEYGVKIFIIDMRVVKSFDFEALDNFAEELDILLICIYKNTKKNGKYGKAKRI